MTTYHCWGVRCVGKMPPGKNVDRHPKGAECEIDGGYVRNWCDKKHNFEVIVGKSTLSFGEDEEP